MKYIGYIFVYFYKWFISPLLGCGPKCRYTPSCSTYMMTALKTHGGLKGGCMGIKRFCRCHPFAKTHFEKTKGYDPVPKKENENE